MTTNVILPKLGFSMSEGAVAEWLVPDGGQVTEGMPLMLIENDKTTSEVEAPATGRLSILIEVGETHPVGTTLATIE